MNGKLVSICATAAAIVGAGLWFFWPAPAPAPQGGAKKATAPAAKRVIPDASKKTSFAKAKPKAKPQLKKAKVVADDETPMTPQEEKLVDSIQDALDEEDFAAVKKLVEDAARSSNPEVRERAVDALQWFGAEAMPELTLFMADENEDVRSSANSAWTMGLSQVEDPQTKGVLVLSAMEIVRNRDDLEMMVMEVNDLDEAKQREILKKLIAGKNKTAADVAREHYEFLTGGEDEAEGESSGDDD